VPANAVEEPFRVRLENDLEALETWAEGAFS
jgi:hypothetical protein